jgi:hypothetical protein
LKSVVTLKTVIRAVLKGHIQISMHESLTDDERVFLERWAEDWTEGAEFTSLWRQMEKDARTLGLCYPLDATAIFGELIKCTLEATRIAFNAKSGDDPDLREKQNRREEILKLAAMADALADYFREGSQYSGFLMHFRETILMPLLKDIEFRRPWEDRRASILQFPGAYELIVPAHSLQQLHEREAQFLRDWAGKEPAPTTFISRKHKHRKRNAFVHSLTDSLYALGVKANGQPHRKAIAVLVNIIFPHEDMDEEGVRKILSSSRR